MKNRRPKSIGFTTIHLIHQDVLRLLAQEKIYKQLYGSRSAVDTLNAVAPVTFGIIQDALRQEMALGVTRTLMDPARTRKNENLGLETLITNMPGDHADLTERIRDLRKKYAPLSTLRNKVRAHRDEKTAYAIAKQQENAFAQVADSVIYEAIQDIKLLMSDALARLPVGNAYDSEVTGPDGDKLIAALSKSA